MSKPDYSPLWKWARVRELARIRKEAGEPFPWCGSDIISSYRFCNVRREDDRVTRWIAANIRKRYKDHENLWLMLCIARVINWPPTLAWIMEVPHAWPDKTFEPTCLEIALDEWQRRGNKVYTGAYTITAPPTKGESKNKFVSLSTIGKLWKDRKRFDAHFCRPRTLENTHGLLKQYHGWGDFMAYQVVVDMRYTDLLARVKDVSSWAAAGPGTKRGLNRLHGRDLLCGLRQDAALYEIQDIFEQYPDHLDFEIDFSDVPNMLCETDKYLRVLNEEGAPRAKYVPGRGW